MSTVFDVEAVEIADESVAAFAVTGVESVTISLDDAPIQTVEVQTEGAVDIVQIEVPGIQGPPGAQNLYVSTTDPSKDAQGNTIWGNDQIDYIWVRKP